MKEYDQIKEQLNRISGMDDKLSFLKFLAFVEAPCVDMDRFAAARKQLEEELLSQDEAESDASDCYPRYF